MARRRTRGAPGPGMAVPTWPRITASLDGNGSGELSWNSTTEAMAATDSDAVHAAIIARCTRLAQTIGRPVRLDLLDGHRMRALAVHPSGAVEAIDADGVPVVRSGEGRELTAVLGTCRGCSTPASAAAAVCQACGAMEPLGRSGGGPRRAARSEGGGEQRGAGGRTRAGRRALLRDAEPTPKPAAAAAAPAAAAKATPAPAPRPAPALSRREARKPATPRSLIIEFEDESRAVLAGGAAVGCNPSAVGGRIPVHVDSRDNTVSRTHALVDLDRAGRILVTDYYSTHGVHFSGRRASTLSPGVAYRVPSGTELRLGDVLCRVTVSTTRTDRSSVPEPGTPP